MSDLTGQEVHAKIPSVRESRQTGPNICQNLNDFSKLSPQSFQNSAFFHDSYAQSLASTRILKHSEQSSRGSCGENLAWASYDQSGGGAFIIVSMCRDLTFTVQPTDRSSLWCGKGNSWDAFPLNPPPPPPP